MGKEILTRLPDGDLDYDGDEGLEDPEEAYRIDWENSSYSW